MATKYKKRADGRYARQVTIGYDRQGKQIKKTIYGKTLKELDKNYREFMELKDKGIIIKNEKMTFEELAELWIQNVKVGNVKSQTLGNIQTQINVINKYIGNLKITDITLSTLEQFRSERLQLGRISQYNSIVSLLKNIFGYAVDKEMLVRNPAEKLSRIRYNGKRQKRKMESWEREIVNCECLTDQERCFLKVLLYTGLRKSEALALSRTDIDFKQRRINVNKTLVSRMSRQDGNLQDLTKTKAGMRSVVIPDPLYEELQAYCKGKSGILFGNRGDYYSHAAFCRAWVKIKTKVSQEIGRELPEDFTPHLFRHTYASDLYQAGIDIKTAQYLLGHSDIKTTLDIYTHFGSQDVQIDKLEDYYKKSKNTQNNAYISQI